jgi:hypothetical protein
MHVFDFTAVSLQSLFRDIFQHIIAYSCQGLSYSSQTRVLVTRILYFVCLLQCPAMTL